MTNLLSIIQLELENTVESTNVYNTIKKTLYFKMSVSFDSTKSSSDWNF